MCCSHKVLFPSKFRRTLQLKWVEWFQAVRFGRMHFIPANHPTAYTCMYTRHVAANYRHTLTHTHATICILILCILFYKNNCLLCQLKQSPAIQNARALCWQTCAE